MDIIQVTNPKFHPQTMRSIVVANARHEIQLATQMRTLGYHRRTFLAKDERERKWLSGRLAEMETSMEASKAREEQEFREKERRRATLFEQHEMNIDRSVADESAIQVMKKLIEAAMESSESRREAAATGRSSRVESPTGDGAVSVKSRASTAKRSGKVRSRPTGSTGSRVQPALASSSTSLAGTEATASRKDVSTERRKNRRSSVTSARSSPDGTGETQSLNERLLANKAASVKLSRQLKAIVSNIYGCEDEDQKAGVKAIVSRLKPLVKRAVDDNGQPLTSLGEDANGDIGAGSETFQTLKNILSKEFADAAAVELEIEEKTAQRLKNRDKKLWEKFGTFVSTNTQPLYLQKRSKFTSRYWDFDTPIEVTQTVTDKDWDELRYCRYLRHGLPKFCKDRQDICNV